MSKVTKVLEAIQRGDTRAADRLLAIVYDELRRMAAAKLAHERPGHTLQTTALVHEAYMRLVGDAGDREKTNPEDDEPAKWQSRGHFFAAAAEAMRRILIENARRRKRLKRGGDRNRVDLDVVNQAIESTNIDLVALDEALTKLEAHDPTKATVVKLRFFAGMTIEQTAESLGISEPTVKRYWFYSRAWLRREIGK